MAPYPDPRRAQAEYLMAVQSVAMAVQNLLLAAHAEGLGACWMCAPLFCGEAVRAALALPADSLTVIVNTGDDFEHLGLPISPDVDTVMYTLAGLANAETGWGLA